MIRYLRKKKSHAFIVGLFSNLNEFINMDMESIVSELPIDNDIKDAPLGKENAPWEYFKFSKSI